MSDQHISQYGPLALPALIFFCLLLFFVGQCGSCLGITYWEDTFDSSQPSAYDKHQKVVECVGKCYEDLYYSDWPAYEVCRKSCKK
jgi:hypothetical protein